MSKALVIKGANFNANKIETIVITTPVPCESITLSQNSLSVTSLGVAGTLTATILPLDTTDQLVWTSSDTDVATVANGVVTAVGIGTATITAMCGERSATCTVSVSVVINLNTEYTYENGYGYSAVQLPDRNWIGRSSEGGSRNRLYYSTTDYLGGYRAFYLSSNAGKYLMPIPKGASHAVVTCEDTWHTIFLILADSLTKSKQTGADGQCAAAVTINYNAAMNLTNYPTANGYIVSLIAPSGVDTNTLTGAVTITFS